MGKSEEACGHKGSHHLVEGHCATRRVRNDVAADDSYVYARHILKYRFHVCTVPFAYVLRISTNPNED
jgi:hypothetical protein